MNKRKVYLDHNATTPLHPQVERSLKEAIGLFGNPSSLHTFGRRAKGEIEEARIKIASFIGAEAGEIIFTGSGSEANNTVLSIFSCPSSQCTSLRGGRSEIMITSIEHPCILETAKCLEEKGTKVSYLDVDKYGKVNLESLKQKVHQKVGLVSVMMANNEIGTTQDIKAIAKIVHSQGALFHTDAVQAVGKIPVDVKELEVDFLTLSGHKIYGPKGIGALYVRKGVPFCPLIRGGHQEKGRRAGTENTLGIIGLAKAIEMRAKEMQEEETRLLKLKLILSQAIEKNIPDLYFNGHPSDCLPGTLNVSFAGAEGEAILLYLDLEGIAVSTGSACASGSLDPSHVLLATGLGAEYAHGSVRISMGRDTTIKDIEYVIKVLPKVIKKIRDMSSAYEKGGNNG
ncbi:MAG: aminotransferase class V-fold PLP-dependent enzyme [Candidatus Omnitrophica bacterium]|nr:aminotransferase class V-fold PLP-dependent enzyme [Candidatus Omnitrophota bacterium]MBU2265976.1 aminotransferase class V-fold PLP-dependent enzyme [Candidatus Omnitrophota bacterium]